MFPVFICHNLPNYIPQAAGSPPSVHRLTLFIYAVLRLTDEHSPSISTSARVITSPSFLFCQFPYFVKFGFSVVQVAHPPPPCTPIVVRTKTLVLHAGRLMRSTRLQDHNSNAGISFSSHFFTAQLSDPYYAMLHTNDLTCCFCSFKFHTNLCRFPHFYEMYHELPSYCHIQDMLCQYN